MLKKLSLDYKYLNEIKPLDWVYFGVVALGAALLYQYRFDMTLSVMHARDLITCIAHGDFLDFYDVVTAKAMDGGYGVQGLGILESANYNIFLYLVLSIIILPFVIIEKLASVSISIRVYLQYVELVILLLDIIAACFVDRVCQTFGFEKNHSKKIGYLFLTSLILLFSTVGFHQLDIIYILFLLLALEEYGKERYLQFSLYMSVAIMLKPFPAFVFFPLILLKIKKVLPAVLYIAIGFFFSFLFYIVFGRGEGYRATKAAMEEHYGFVDRLSNFGVESGVGILSFMLIVFVLVCIFAYCSHPQKGIETYKYVVFLGLSLFTAFSAFVLWHPQWMAILALFTVMALPVATNRKAVFFCDIFAGTGYFIISYIKYFHPGWVESLVNGGILPMLFRREYTGPKATDALANIIDIDFLGRHAYAVMISSLLAMCALVYKSLKDDREVDSSYERVLVYARSIPLLVYQVGILFFYFKFK